MMTSMINGITRITFFIAAFFPLWAIMMYLTIAKYGYDGIYLFVYIGLSMIIAVCISHVRTDIRDNTKQAENSKCICIVSKSETTRDYVISVIPYLLIIASINITPQSIVSIICVFCIIGILYMRTNMVLTNPMLLLIGFRIFEIKYYEIHDENIEKSTLLLSKKMPWDGDPMTIVEIYKGIYTKSIK